MTAGSPALVGDTRRKAATVLLALAVGCGCRECDHSDRRTAARTSATAACAGHCQNGRLDCGEVGFDCGGECVPCEPFDVEKVCGPRAPLPWRNPHPVPVVLPGGASYEANIEEPEVREQSGHRWLFFNDEAANGNKDLRYAWWDGAAGRFVSLGPLPNGSTSTATVNGNPSLDRDGTFFFVSNRDYAEQHETIFAARLTVQGGVPPRVELSDLRLLRGLTRTDGPWVAMGVQVSWDGRWLYFDEAKFDRMPPTRSDILLAVRKGTSYERLPAAVSAHLLGAVNTETFLEYAEAPSRDGLQLYFTRAHIGSGTFCTMVSTRRSIDAPFGPPVCVWATEPQKGVLQEAPSLAPDEKTLYYHRRGLPDGVARLYAVERP